MIEVKGFHLDEGLWWEEIHRVEGWVLLRLIGVSSNYKGYRDALDIVAKAMGIPPDSVQKLLDELRPDLTEHIWHKVYLSASVREDQVVSKNNP